MTSLSTSKSLPLQSNSKLWQPVIRFAQQRNLTDYLFAALLTLVTLYALQRYQASMDGYETGILIGSLPAMICMGWFWRPLRGLSVGAGALALVAMALYNRVPDAFGADLSQAENVFLLKYGLSSQSAILWMSALFFLSTLFYGLSLASKADINGTAPPMARIGSGLAWSGVLMALVGTLVRWFESHQIAADIGHIPVSNLYEVFVLFAWLTTLFYLYFEQRYRTTALGAFVMLIVSCAVSFLLWYAVSRDAQEIQPLVPALQSWWMKLHVPANFVGYGTFALAAMVALAYLLKSAKAQALWVGLVVIPGVILMAVLAFAFLGNFNETIMASLSKTARMLGGLTAFFALAVAARGALTKRLPDLPVLDDLMYRAIAVGFAFFTIATILGAFWAAEAWGGYWSWDPKETWALIVWLNYAAWLHMRLVKGLRGQFSAWWSLTGLVITTFAFLGVNMFLSGLHSYGEL